MTDHVMVTCPPGVARSSATRWSVIWVPLGVLIGGVVLAAVVFGFGAYELNWKMHRLRADIARLEELQRQHGLAMLFISHDLAVVGDVASRLAVMNAGEVVETGPARRLLTSPEHPYTKSLLAAVPTLRTDRSRPLAMVE